jgi:hypothetical protein
MRKFIGWGNTYGDMPMRRICLMRNGSSLIARSGEPQFLLTDFALTQPCESGSTPAGICGNDHQQHDDERLRREMKKLAVIRRGHMGDVLITDPVIRPLRSHFDHLTIYTDFPKAAGLLDLYDEIRPYSEHLVITPELFDKVLCPVYETYPGINHLDGYARCLGIFPHSRVPTVKRDSPRIAAGRYALVAPHTSEFVRQMREWPFARFEKLAGRLEAAFQLPVIILRPEHTFEQMVSLIEHCSWFVGNDSGPAILAQCFAKTAFVLFGATRPGLVLLSDLAVPLIHDVSCNGCKHVARHTDIECASPLCLLDFGVDEAMSQICAARSRIERN